VKCGVFFAAALLIGGACSAFAAVGDSHVLATIGKEKITVKDLNDRLQSYPAQYAEVFQQKENKVKVLDQMIDERLLLAAARKSKISKSAEYKKQMQIAEQQLLLGTLMRDRIDSKVVVSDEDVQKYFIENPGKFSALEQRRASHILLRSEPEAQDVLKRLKAGEDFAQLAKDKSDDKATAVNGGELGWFSKGQMVPEFEQAAFGLAKGQLSGIVKTQFGYHIVQLNDIQVRPKIDFTPQVAEQIKEALVLEKKRELTNDYLTQLKKDVVIKRDISNIQ
jgi:peptidyl-prolyl cis-trans isomerase C